MINFYRPIKLRGSHAAYAWYLSKNKGSIREGGVNIFNIIIYAYMFAVLVGLKFNATSEIDDSTVLLANVFNGKVEGEVTSSDIPADTVSDNQKQLNYIYKLVMLTENERDLSDEEKISNAFKSEGNQEKIDDNISLMHKYARGGLEIMYDRFGGLTDIRGIQKAQLELLEDVSEILDTDN